MAGKTRVLLLFAAAALTVGTLAACSGVSVLNAVTPGSTYDKTAGLSYGNDPRQKLDVYTPRGLQGNAPVVVFFYGGNWNAGARADYVFVGEALASRGIVAVVVDYRLAPRVRYPEILSDSAAAVTWSYQHVAQYGGDPKRLFVMGHSAGAYNAAMVALDGRLLQANGLNTGILRGWIGLAGPYDFLPIENPDIKPTFFAPDSPPDSQPVNHVTGRAPPALLIASRKDKLVDPQRNTGGLAQRLRAAHVPVQEIYTDHTSHATLVGALSRPLRGLAPVLDDVVAFVNSDAGRTPAPAALPAKPDRGVD